MILLLCMQPWFSIDECDSKPIKVTWKSIFWIRNPKHLSPHWNYQVFDIFSPFLLVLNHICQSRIKVACKVAKSFLTLFPVTLVKVEVQESNLHQMNHKKVYFLTCFMQNIQKPNMVGSRALNDRSNHYGPPCIHVCVNILQRINYTINLPIDLQKWIAYVSFSRSTLLQEYRGILSRKKQV